MSESFVGEIRMFAGNFAPRGWAFCEGQLMAIAQNNALFSLLGTIYGGDGRTTFGLPDLRGRIPIHAGNGPGLTDRRLGARSGAETNTLTVNTMPSHTHTVPAAGGAATQQQPTGASFAATQSPQYASVADGQSVGLSGSMVGNAGQQQPHSLLMPTQCVYFIISLFGVYPSRN